VVVGEALMGSYRLSLSPHQKAQIEADERFGLISLTDQQPYRNSDFASIHHLRKFRFTDWGRSNQSDESTDNCTMDSIRRPALDIAERNFATPYSMP
jgi:hypothetical protein